MTSGGSLMHLWMRLTSRIENIALDEIPVSISLTIQIPPELEAQITHRAAQLNISPETFVLQSLQQAIQGEENEYEDEPKEAIEALNYAALNDPEESVRTQLIQAIRNFHRPQSLIAMSEQPKVQMNFNAPVTGVAGNVEGDFMVNASEQDLETILTDITQILENLKQKHPTPPHRTNGDRHHRRRISRN
jgi:hypothetical protein